MYISIDGYNINYIEEGKGELVVLLHGWGSNYKCFFPLINLLKTKYKVLAFDLPGFGESDDLKKSFFVDDYADIVARIISKKTTLNENVILIGHSYGGRIIIKLNSRDNLPFEIKKNILIDAAGIKDIKDIKTKIKIFIFKLIKNVVKVLPIPNDKKKAIIDKYRLKFASTDYINASNELKETLVKSVNEDLTSYLKQMKETLLIWGDKDTATPLYMARIMEKNIENSGLVILNGGHFSFIDDQFKFLNVMKYYLNMGTSNK